MNEEKDNVQRRSSECRSGEQRDNQPVACQSVSAIGGLLGWPLKLLKDFWVHPKN